MSLDKATINDYVKNLTVASPSRDRKRINFELTLQTSDDEKRVVGFNPKNQKLMSEIHQAEAGCELKKYKLNDKNEITVNDDTVLTEIKSTFECQQKQATYFCISTLH